MNDRTFLANKATASSPNRGQELNGTSSSSVSHERLHLLRIRPNSIPPSLFTTGSQQSQRLRKENMLDFIERAIVLSEAAIEISQLQREGATAAFKKSDATEKKR